MIFSLGMGECKNTGKFYPFGIYRNGGGYLERGNVWSEKDKNEKGNLSFAGQQMNIGRWGYY